jgi:hypothetical protein
MDEIWAAGALLAVYLGATLAIDQSPRLKPHAYLRPVCAASTLESQGLAGTV